MDYFVLFLLAIVLSPLLRFTTSDYPFGIFKLFTFPVLEYFVVYLFISCNSLHIEFEVKYENYPFDLLLETIMVEKNLQYMRSNKIFNVSGTKMMHIEETNNNAKRNIFRV